jgi:molybdopterin molybdotransferase
LTNETTGDCARPGDRSPDLTMEQALERLLAYARPVAETESVPTSAALGRVLAQAIVSPIPVPGWDNGAMDGYAVRVADLLPNGGRLRVSQRIPAGAVGNDLAPRTAARIFTGAPIPPGADAVAIQEACRRDGEWVHLPLDLLPGANIRRAGEDIAAGAEVIAAGIRLRPQHLGLAASVGASELRVRRRLRVAIFSSGDELAMPGKVLAPGQIYNSNRFTLHGLLQALACKVQDLGVVEDELDATAAVLARGAEHADLVIASGGVSVGEEDHVKAAVERVGTLVLWRIAIRPGKPLAFAQIGPRNTPFIGAPGNPVSLFTSFCLFARPLILRMQGVTEEVVPQVLTAKADFDWPRPDRRREYLRARLAVGPDGDPCVQVYPSRSSAVLSSVAWANGLAVIPEGRVLAKGDKIGFIPFSELLT